MNTVSATDQLPPHEPQSEWMLMACLCNKPDILPELSEDLFYLIETQKVLEVVRTLHASSRPIDMFSVPVVLRSLKLFEVMTHLMEADQALSSPHNFSYWLDILKEYRAARQVGALTVSTQAMVAHPGAGNRPDLLSVGNRFRDIAVQSQPHSQPCGMQTLVQDAVQKLEQEWNDPESAYGIKSGFTDLDKLTLGFKPGELIVIAARPGQGKTAIGLQMAICAALESRAPTLFFSLEMDKNQLVKRALASLCKFNMRQFQSQHVSEDEFRRFGSSTACLAGAPLQIQDETCDISEISGMIAQSVTSDQTKLVVVDYLQRIRMTGNRESYYTQVGLISNRLKEIAMANKIPVIVLAQLSREVEKENRKPRLSDLRDSGVIEQDADVLLFIHQMRGDSVVPHVIPVELIISKHRNGPCGVVQLVFREDISRFESSI